MRAFTSKGHQEAAVQPTFWSSFRKDRLLYIMAIPGIVYFLLFRYLPMLGISIAFMDYNVYQGFGGSTWVGLQNFTDLFSMYGFQEAFRNTLIISFAKIIFGFPIPILFAILLNEVTHSVYKKTVQTVVCLPNFISWIVVQGLLYALFSPSTGALQSLLDYFGYQGQTVNLLASKEYFQGLIVVSDIWKTFGYSSILYTATISTIDQQLYEAAQIDGAGKLRQIWHITLSGLRPTIVIMLILRVGTVLDAGFDQIFAISNPMVTEVAEILDTFVYKMGINQMNFSIATAAGFIKSIVGLVMVLLTNWAVRRIDPDSALI